MRYCPTSKQVPPNVSKDDAPNKRHFYALWTRGAKPDEGDVMVSSNISLVL